MYGCIPANPSVPNDQQGKNISDVKLIRNIASPGLKDHEKIVCDWNVKLKFGGKEVPYFKGNLVMKEKVRDSLLLLQTANTSRGQRDALLFESAVNWYPVMEDFPNEDRNGRPDEGGPEIFEDGRKGAVRGWFPMHKILMLRINGGLQNKLHDKLRNNFLQFINIPSVVGPKILDQGIRRSVGVHEGMKGACREPPIIPERYITSSKAPKNVLLRDSFHATNSSPNVRVLRFSFSRGSWPIEARAQRYFLAPKSYFLETEEGDNVLKHKGAAKAFISKEWFESQYQDLSRTEQIQVSANFRIDYKSMNITRKNTMVRLGIKEGTKRKPVYDENIWVDTEPIEITDLGKGNEIGERNESKEKD
ncbi:UNVERIFIED_CONTAM: hypothetical protein Sindi_2666600 [Sesamum indicum]